MSSPTNNPLAPVAPNNLMDVVRTVQAMNSAQAIWIKVTREERDQKIQKLLTSFVDGLARSKDALAEILNRDIGMPLQLAQDRSVPAAIEIIRETILVFEKNKTGFPANGNAAVFLGWTDPLLSFCRRVPQILAAGNAVCVKPSSHAPHTVAVVAEIFAAAMVTAEVPSGLFAILNGRGAGEDEIGDILLRHPGIKSIYWIGSTDGALKARAVAEEHDKRFHYTGSGRNPFLLFQGFEPSVQEKIINDLAQAIADPHGFGPYRPSRIFVQDSIYKDVLEKLALTLSQIQVGWLPQKEAERFDLQIKLALSEAGHLVTGGTRNGSVAAPTLVRDLTNCSTLQSEELAGPWATIASFKYPHEALKYANTSPLGLAGFVLHPYQEKAEIHALKLEASRVFFTSQPPWPQAFTRNAAPVKKSANRADGIAEIYAQGQWRAEWFS